MNSSEIARRYGLPEDDVSNAVEHARRSMAPYTKSISVQEKGVSHTLKVTREGVGPLDTRFGIFHLFNFTIEDKWHKYSALCMSQLSPTLYPIFENASSLLLRTDSGCETGQVFGDRTCECKDQLDNCMEMISKRGEGIIINIPRQDGRGMGLPFKLATLYLQKQLGIDTVEASSMLEPDRSRDLRTYAGVVAILKFFLIRPEVVLHLASNNPDKTNIFVENGFTPPILDPLIVTPTELTRKHLKAKQRELGHINLVGIISDEG